MAITILNNRAINRSDTASAGQNWTATSATASDFQAGGGVNTPAFEATISSEQNPSSGSYTKINFDNEIFDTDGAYNTSNKRFTPGVAGRYFIYCNACLGSGSNSTLANAYLATYKNGSLLKKAFYMATTNYTRYHPMTVGNIIDLDADDYVEMYAQITLQSGTVEIRTAESFFGGYKLIT